MRQRHDGSGIYAIAAPVIDLAFIEELRSCAADLARGKQIFHWRDAGDRDRRRALEGRRRPRPPPRGGSGRRARRPEFRRRGNRPAEQATGAAPPSSAAASALGTRSDGCKPRCPRLAATSAGRGRSDRRRRLARPARHQLQAPDRSLASAGRAAAVPGGSRGRCPHRCTWRRRPSIHQQAERLPRGDHHRTGMTQIARNRGPGIPQGPRLHFRIHPRMDRLYYPLSIAPRQRRRHLPGRGGARARDRAGRRGVAEHRQFVLRAVPRSPGIPDPCPH